MKTNYEKVECFNEAFNCLPNRSKETMLLRLKLIQEEVAELEQAVKDNDHEEILDALVDIEYVTHGMAHIMGYDSQTAFDRVHDANMAKLDINGKPIINGQNGVYDETRPMGKVLKPEGWKAASLKGCY